MSADQILTPSQQQVVLDFINQRPEYINAMENSGRPDGDYHRWAGNAEARRQLATRLGLTVPHKWGQRAESAMAQAIRRTQ
jgi:hypothetical protein